MSWGLRATGSVIYLKHSLAFVCVVLASAAGAAADCTEQRDAEQRACVHSTTASQLGYLLQVSVFWLFTAYCALLLTHIAVGLEQPGWLEPCSGGLIQSMCDSISCTSGLLMDVCGVCEDMMQQMVAHTSHPVFCLLAAVPAAHVAHTVLQGLAHLAAAWGGLQPMGDGKFSASSVLLAILNALILGSLSTHLKAAKASSVEELLNDLLPAHVSAAMLQQQQQAAQESLTRSSSIASDGAPIKVQNGNPGSPDTSWLDSWATSRGNSSKALAGPSSEVEPSGNCGPRRSTSVRFFASKSAQVPSTPSPPPTPGAATSCGSPFAPRISEEEGGRSGNALARDHATASIGTVIGGSSSANPADPAEIDGALLESGSASPKGAAPNTGFSSLAVSSVLEALRWPPMRRPSSSANGFQSSGSMTPVDETCSELYAPDVRTSSCTGYAHSNGTDSPRRSFQRPPLPPRARGRLSTSLPFSPFKAASNNGTLPPGPPSTTSWRDKCLSPLRHVLPAEVLGLATSAAAAISPPSPRLPLATAVSAPVVSAPDAPAYVEVHDCVTVLFADIAGFTAMAAQCEPEAVMAMLNKLYYGFDEATRVLPVYKVETIGDCYMAATSLIHVDPFHASTMLQYAQMMQEHAKTVSLPTDPSKHVQLRIGIHSGPCTSGVVGQIRRRYCLFGNTINTASRMESCGVPGRIQISADTHQLLLQQSEPGAAQEWECRGPIAVKGRGELTTYLHIQKVAEMRGPSIDDRQSNTSTSTTLQAQHSAAQVTAAATVAAAAAVLVSAAIGGEGNAYDFTNETLISEAITCDMIMEDLTSDVINSDVITDDMMEAVRAAKAGGGATTAATATTSASAAPDVNGTAATATTGAAAAADGRCGNAGIGSGTGSNGLARDGIAFASAMCGAGGSTASISADQDRDTATSLTGYAAAADQARMLMAGHMPSTHAVLEALAAASVYGSGPPARQHMMDNFNVANWSNGGFSSCSNAYNDGPSESMIDRFFLSGMSDAVLEGEEQSLRGVVDRSLVDSYASDSAAMCSAPKTVTTPAANLSEVQPPGPFAWGSNCLDKRTGSSSGSSSANSMLSGEGTGKFVSGCGYNAPTVPVTGRAAFAELAHGSVAGGQGLGDGLLGGVGRLKDVRE